MRDAPQSREPETPLFAFDLARAAAAVTVVVSHARDLILLDASEQPALSPAGRVFYALSGLGHQAVIVFFVISGFLVTRSMRRAAGEGRWSLTSFAVARLTRLWVVLIPCLIIGAVLDRIGTTVTGAQGYGALSGGPSAPPALDVPTFIGNVLFLQTIAVKPFGSNGALWSLANEAWYYALAAMAYAAWRWRVVSLKAIVALAALALSASLLPMPILALAPVWACGAGLALLEPKLTAPKPLTVGASGLAVIAILALSRLRAGDPVLLDLLLGLAATCLLRCGVLWDAGAGRWTGAVRTMSRLSYSLYLSHLPLLVLATSIGLGGRHQSFGLRGVCQIMAAICLALIFATGVWWCFERHTGLVRTWVTAVVTRVRHPGFQLRATADRRAAS